MNSFGEKLYTTYVENRDYLGHRKPGKIHRRELSARKRENFINISNYCIKQIANNSFGSREQMRRYLISSIHEDRKVIGLGFFELMFLKAIVNYIIGMILDYYFLGEIENS